MQIRVDTDACKAIVKDILFRAAEREHVQLTLVASRLLHVPPSRFIKSVQIERGFDVADNAIAKLVQPGDPVP